MNYLDVELRHIDLARGDTRVLRDVSWRVRPGERWALVGHNGAGKTQLLKLLAGDVWPQASRRSRRWYRFGGERFDQPLGIKEKIAYVGAERQDRYARYDWNLSVADLVGTGLFATDIVLHRPDAAGRRRVAAMLRRLGLAEFAERKLLTLSYGERRLALIARALVGHPRLLLLDEAFNGLDALRRARLMRLLQASARSRLPWVLSAHRAEDIPDAVTHVILLDKGRVRYAGRKTRASLLAAFPALRTAGGRVRGGTGRIAGRGAAALRIKDAALGTDAGGSEAAAATGSAAPALMQLSAVDVYVEHHPVLHAIDWTLRRGEHWAVLGRNGSGKSTLLRTLYGDLPAALGGRIERAGFVRGTPIEEFKRTVGFLSPDLQSDHAREELDVRTIVMSGRHASIGLNDPPTAADQRAARHWLEFFRIEEWSARRPRQLSYGQMRRVLLARAMVNSPRLLLLDEPCTGLDAATRAIVLAHLQRLAQDGVQLVMATHHADDVIPAINRLLRLEQGRIAGEEKR